MSAVPAWKQAILNKKREKEEEEERARREEEQRLSKLPQWKRDLILRKHASEDKGSPPLNRTALGKMTRTGSIQKKVPTNEKHTLGLGARERTGSDSTPSTEKDPVKSTPTAAVPAGPSNAGAEKHESPTPPAAIPPSTSTENTMAGDEEARPKVKDLLGLFGAGRPRLGSDDKTSGLAPVGERQRRPTPGANASRPVASAVISPSQEYPTGTVAAEGSPTEARSYDAAALNDEDDGEECTLIDDVVEEIPSKTLFIKTPPRQEGVQSAPVSPTGTPRGPRMERRPSCLATTDKPRKMRRSVSFNELQLATVHHYERLSSPDEPEDNDSPSKDPLPSIIKPIKSSPGLSQPKPAGAPGSSDGGGFQSFQPKTLADDSQSNMPTAGSWRTQVTPVKTKPAKEEEKPKSEEVEEVDGGNTSALLW